jgi:hypothetical protein
MKRTVYAALIFFGLIFILTVKPNIVYASCQTDYSTTDGNLIFNPYFECDGDANNIPDGWTKHDADANHLLTVVDDPTNSGYGKVIKSEYINNVGQSDFGWFAQNNLILDINSWYELTITYKIQNIGLNLTADNKIKESTNWLGVSVNRYTSRNNFIYFPLSSIFPVSPKFTSWDTADNLFNTYSIDNSSDWVTKTIYFKTSQFDAYAIPRTYHYPPGIFYLAEYILKKVPGNLNPENENFSHSGTLNTFMFKDNPFFPIVLNNYPKSGGVDLDIDQVKSAGFNTVGNTYRSYTKSEYQTLLTQKNLATIVHINCLPWSNEFGCNWGNDPDNSVNFQGYNIALSLVDSWKDFNNVLFFDALLDEMDCNPQAGQTYIGYLDTYSNLINYIRSNSNLPIYGNFCGGTYTRDYDDEIDYYLSLADIFSFTQNTRSAYDKESGPNSGIAGLPNVGYQIRQGLSAMLRRGAQKKALAFGLGTYWWSSWNGNEYNSNTYTPYSLQRFQIWDQIINGATGVLFFLQSVNLDDSYYNFSFKQMKAIAKELNDMQEVLLESQYYDEWNVSDSRVEVMMKKHNGKIYLLTASTAQENLSNITISLNSKYSITDVKVLSDVTNGDFSNPSDRFITPTSSNTFTDDFFGEDVNSPQGFDAPGYGVHIYEISYNLINTFVNSSTISHASGCSYRNPGDKAPWIYGAIPQDPNSIKVYFTESSQPVTHYVLEFGTKSGEYQFGLPDMGINEKNQMAYNVQILKPNTRYYFRIRAGNGCATGVWSNEVSAKTMPIFTQYDLTNNELTNHNQESADNSTAVVIKETLPIPVIRVPESIGITVKVEDSTGKPLVGAEVTLHSNVQTKITDNNGRAIFQGVEPGGHVAVVKYKNFEKQTRISVQNGLSSDTSDYIVTIKTVADNSVSVSGVIFNFSTLFVVKFANTVKKFLFYKL